MAARGSAIPARASRFSRASSRATVPGERREAPAQTIKAHAGLVDVDLSPDATSVAYAVQGDSQLFVLSGF